MGGHCRPTLSQRWVGVDGNRLSGRPAGLVVLSWVWLSLPYLCG